MSQTIHNAIKAAGDNDFSAEQRRSFAVAAALEAIAAKAAGGSDAALKSEFFYLSEYADKIQEALKVK